MYSEEYPWGGNLERYDVWREEQLMREDEKRDQGCNQGRERESNSQDHNFKRKILRQVSNQ